MTQTDTQKFQNTFEAGKNSGADIGGPVLERGRELASDTYAKAKEAVCNLGECTADALSEASAKVGEGIASAKTYVADIGANDISNLIRRYPIPSLLFGIGVGVLVSRTMSLNSRTNVE